MRKLPLSLLKSIVTLIIGFSPVSAFAQNQIFLDYRSEFKGESETPSNISAKTKSIVISQAVKNTDKPCFGKLEPEVIDYASGSFTTPKVKQVAYLVNLGDSCHPRARGTVRLAIFSGNNLVTYGDATGYYDIKKISDVNVDGVNELTLEGSWLGQGYLSIYAKVVEMKKRGMLTLREFGEVFGNNPGNFDDVKYQTVSVISASKIREGKIAFTRANYVSQCFGDTNANFINTECGAYQYISSSEPPNSDKIAEFLKKTTSDLKTDIAPTSNTPSTVPEETSISDSKFKYLGHGEQGQAFYLHKDTVTDIGSGWISFTTTVRLPEPQGSEQVLFVDIEHRASCTSRYVGNYSITTFNSNDEIVEEIKPRVIEYIPADSSILDKGILDAACNTQ